MIGHVFGNWTVVTELPKDKHGKRLFLCRCSCKDHTEKEVTLANLRNGKSMSCGCLRRKMDKQYKTNDGVVVNGTTPFYRVWSNMKQCCDSPSYKTYQRYGGSGISYQPSWKTLDGFCEDMLSTYNTGDSLQRRDNSKDFSKDNCYWANRDERVTASFQDLTGQRFGKIVVQKMVGKTEDLKPIWECKCDCGTVTNIVGGSLRSGLTTSCGCYHLEVVTKHGYTTHSEKHPLYNTWSDMKTRCTNPSCEVFKWYGGRGIKYTDRWESFENFLIDMGTGYVAGLTLDRINPDLGYFKENCRWVTKTEQTRNKTNTRKVTWNGEERVLVEVCKELNLHYAAVLQRITEYGWDDHRALTTPTSKPYVSRSQYE